VELPAGEHILRFMVTGSWMDVDYFAILKEDAEIDCVVDCTDFAKPTFAKLATEAENYRIFDINGVYLGNVRAAGTQELRAGAAKLVKRGGAFIAKAASGRILRIHVGK